jgi:O-antigen ligase
MRLANPVRARRFGARGRPPVAPVPTNAVLFAAGVRSLPMVPVSATMLIGLSAMLLTIVFRLHETIPALRFIRPAFVSGAVGAVLAWSAASRFDRAAVWSNQSMRGLLVFFGWCVLTVPTALYPGLAASTLNVVLPAVELMLVCLLLPPSMQSLDRFLLLFAAGGGMLGAAALTVGYSLDGRLAVTTTLDTNDLGAIMATACTLALGLLRRKSILMKLCAMAILSVTVLVLVRTGSRGGVVGLAVGTLVFALLTPGVARVRWLILLGAGAAISWPFAPANFRERITGLTSVEEDYNNTAYGGRKQIWTRGVGYALSHPLLGIGASNFPIAEGDYLTDAGVRGKWSNAHNAVVQVAAELGIPGLVIFVTLLGYSVRRSLLWGATLGRAPPAGANFRPEIAASLLAFLTCSMFLSAAYSYALYALIGMVALAERVRVRLEQSAGRRV